MKTLDGLKWKPKWVSHLGCLKGCIDFLGLPVSEAWLFGATGHAFLLNIHELVCPSGPTAWNTEFLFRGSGNVGCSVDRIWGHKHESDFRDKQKRAWEEAVSAIDQGVPCYGWELNIPEYYVIHGYDGGGYLFSGPLCEEGKGPKPWQELGNTEIGVIEMNIVRAGESAQERTVVKEALSFAVQLSADPGKWAFPLYKTGLAGYDLWGEALKEGRAHNLGMAYNAAVWAECRAHAMQFLEDAAARLPGICDPLFAEAVSDYEVVADSLQAVSELFPFVGVSEEEKEKNVRDPERQGKALEYLDAARSAEKSGLVMLERIVASL